MTGMQHNCAVIVIGHGSIHSDSGKAMMRIASDLREHGLYPIVEAAFLNFNRPSLADAMAKCIVQGATHWVIQPYFLIDGQYAGRDLPKLVDSVAAELLLLCDSPAHVEAQVALGAPFGYHDALVNLAMKRILAVDPEPQASSALLFVAHGTPLPHANDPIYAIATRVGEMLGYRCTCVAFLDCNEPSIPAAIAQLVGEGYQRIVIQPYFLHLGRHVRTDLPALFANAQASYPALQLRIAHHLDYDPLLIAIIADRIKAAMGTIENQRYSCSHEEL